MALNRMWNLKRFLKSSQLKPQTSIVKYSLILAGTGLLRVVLKSIVAGRVRAVLLKRRLPGVWRHLSAHSVEPCHIVVEWFMCLFTRTLCFRAACRVLDQFFCEGIKVRLRFPLARPWPFPRFSVSPSISRSSPYSPFFSSYAFTLSPTVPVFSTASVLPYSLCCFLFLCRWLGSRSSASGSLSIKQGFILRLSRSQTRVTPSPVRRCFNIES